MKRTVFGGLVLAAAAALACGAAAQTSSGASAASDSYRTGSPSNAFEEVDSAVRVLRTMMADPALRTSLRAARGVYVVPAYGRVAAGVGLRGGSGVLLVRRGADWVIPSFYKLGGISAGAQLGAEGGAIAMILNNQRALNSFRQENNFSLNADAGLTVLAWSGKAQRSVGNGDVTIWSNAKGLFGDLAVSVTDIHFDQQETRAYYGVRLVSAADVIDGRVHNPHAMALRRALEDLPSG